MRESKNSSLYGQSRRSEKHHALLQTHFRKNTHPERAIIKLHSLRTTQLPELLSALLQLHISCSSFVEDVAYLHHIPFLYHLTKIYKLLFFRIFYYNKTTVAASTSWQKEEVDPKAIIVLAAISNISLSKRSRRRGVSRNVSGR